MNWLYYLAEANIYLGVFYLAYCLFLNRETYYQLNRAYLIVSCVVSFVLPVMQIGALKPVEAVETSTLTYTVPVQTTQVAAPIAAPAVIEHHLTLPDYLWYAYLAGAIVLLLVLAIKLYTLFKLTRSAQFIEQGKHKVIYLAETDVAFSFLNYLFIGTNAPGANTMIRHELVHIRQRHSADIIFVELLKIISWFNPCIYLLQNSLKTVHEYIADEQTAAYETDALTYSSFLVNNAYGAGGSSITHSFFNYNLLKKRIIMLNQQRSGNLARLKYLVAVPICAGLLCASTLAFSKNYGWVDLAPAKVKSLSADSADIVTPSGYKRGYEKLVWHFNVKSIFFLNNYMQKDFMIDNKNLIIKGGIVVVGFNVTDEHKLSDLKVISSTNDELNSVITNSLASFNGAINDKPGAHTFLFHISTTGHTEEEDEVICRKYGYDNHYTIAIAPKITVNGAKNPPQTVKPDSKVKKFPPPIVKPDNKVKSFPPPIVKPDKTSYIIDPANYNADMLYDMSKKLYKLGFQMDFKEIKTNGSNQLQVSLETLPSHNWHQGGSATFDLDALKKLNYVIAVGGDNEKQMIYVHSVPNPDKYPRPVVKPDTTSKRVSDAFYKYLRQSIHYPAEARSNNITGRVIATFTVADNKLKDIKVVRDIGHGTNEELARVLKNYTPNDNIEPGKYVIPVFFAIAGLNFDAQSYPPDIANRVREHLAIGSTHNNDTVWGLEQVVVVSYKER